MASHNPSHPFEDLLKSLKPHPNKGESVGFTDLQISIHKLLKGTLTFSEELSLKVKPQILNFSKLVHLVLAGLPHPLCPMNCCSHPLALTKYQSLLFAFCVYSVFLQITNHSLKARPALYL